MGQLNNVPSLITGAFTKMTSYYDGVAGFQQDPTAPAKDFAEITQGIDTTGLKQAVQARVKGRASTTNVALISTYRDLDSMQAEAAIRAMTRADYYREAATEASISASAWKTEMRNRMYNLTGVRAPQG